VCGFTISATKQRESLDFWLIFLLTERKCSGGGMYSSSSDLAKLAKIFVQCTTSPAVTRRWMKPLRIHQH